MCSGGGGGGLEGGKREGDGRGEGEGVATGLQMTFSFTDMNRGSFITKRKKIHDLCVSPVLLTCLFLDGTSDQSKTNK